MHSFKVSALTVHKNSLATFTLTSTKHVSDLQIPLHPSEMSHVLSTLKISHPQTHSPLYPSITYQTPHPSDEPAHRTLHIKLPPHCPSINAVYTAPFHPAKLLYTLTIPHHPHPTHASLNARLILDNASRFDLSDVPLSISNTPFTSPVSIHPVGHIEPRHSFRHLDLPCRQSEHPSPPPPPPFVFGRPSQTSTPIFRQDKNSFVEDRPSDEEQPQHTDLEAQMAKLNCSVTTAQRFHVGTTHSESSQPNRRTTSRDTKIQSVSSSRDRSATPSLSFRVEHSTPKNCSATSSSVQSKLTDDHDAKSCSLIGKTTADSSTIGKRNIHHQFTQTCSDSNSQADNSISQRLKTRKTHSAFRFVPINLVDAQKPTSPNHSASSNFQFQVVPGANIDANVDPARQSPDPVEHHVSPAKTETHTQSHSRALDPSPTSTCTEPLVCNITPNVSVPQQMSTLVPFLDQKCDAGIILLYSRHLDAKHPCTSIWMKNCSEITLLPGAIAVYMRNELVAEMSTKPCRSGESLYIPGEANEICDISVVEHASKRTVLSKSCVNGKLRAEVSRVWKTTYTITNGLRKRTSAELHLLHSFPIGSDVYRSELSRCAELEPELVNYESAVAAICEVEEDGKESEVLFKLTLESGRDIGLEVYHEKVDSCSWNVDEMFEEEVICELETVKVVDGSMARGMRELGKRRADTKRSEEKLEMRESPMMKTIWKDIDERERCMIGKICTEEV